jgi:transcriptional regulator GlxA family with amidase domain
VGATPAGYVAAQRVEGARRLLEATEQSVAEIALACGFGSAETMHRAFQRSVRITPGQYRRHFRAAPGSGGVMRHHDGKAKSPSRRLA